MRRALAFACLAAAGCGGDSTGPTGTPTSLALVTAPSDTVMTGAVITPSPVVELRDANNHAVTKSGVAVTASLAGATLGGTTTASTDAAGRAHFSALSASGTPGAHQLTFASTGLTAVTRSVVLLGSPSMRMAARDTATQAALLGTAVPVPPAVVVTDSTGHPVAGIPVVFTVTGGGGSVTDSVRATDGSGIAMAGSWIVGPAPGPNTLAARAPFSGGQVTFRATAVNTIATRMEKVAGDFQRALAGSILSVKPAVRVLDNNSQPMSGVVVTFRRGLGTSTVTDTVQTTDAQGVATIGSWQPIGAGSFTLIVTAAGTSASPVEFTATMDVVGDMIPISDTRQVVGVGQVALRPALRLTNSDNSPGAGVTVRFAITQGSGAISTAPEVTNPVGEVTLDSWIVSATPGMNEVVASAPGYAPLTEVFQAYAVTAPPGRLAILSGDNQQAVDGTALPQPLVVQAADDAGTPMPGYSLSFTTSSGQIVATPGSTPAGSVTVVTDANGVASVAQWIMPLQIASGLHLNVSGPGLLPNVVSFTASSTTGGPAHVGTLGSATGVVGATINGPAALVTDANGYGVAGVTVNFAVTSGGGSLASTQAVTNAQGKVTPTWTLGTVAGAQTLSATVTGISPATLTATVDPATAATMTFAAGEGQSAVIWHRLPVDPAVDVRDQYGNAATTSFVTFTVLSGGGRLTSTLVHPGADGKARGAWSLGPAPGANSLSAAIPNSTVSNVITFNATALPTSSPYNIDARVVGTLTAAQQAAVDAAVTRWRVVVSGDLPAATVNLAANGCVDGQPALNETIDDIVIYVEIGTIDGPGNVLGGAGPCILRATGGLPSVGAIQLDAADLSGMDQAELDDLVLHEMGHVLGFGTVWASPLLTGAGTSDPRFTGSSAIAGYHLLGGNQISVPVENTGGDGTADSHWRESVFANELMTGYIGGGGNPLTGMTIGSLQDLGYSVDYASAEPLGFTVSFARTRVPSGPQLREMPLRSPILIMAPDGTVVGRRNR